MESQQQSRTLELPLSAPHGVGEDAGAVAIRPEPSHQRGGESGGRVAPGLRDNSLGIEPPAAARLVCPVCGQSPHPSRMRLLTRYRRHLDLLAALTDTSLLRFL